MATIGIKTTATRRQRRLMMMTGKETDTFAAFAACR